MEVVQIAKPVKEMKNQNVNSQEAKKRANRTNQIPLKIKVHQNRIILLLKSSPPHQEMEIIHKIEMEKIREKTPINKMASNYAYLQAVKIRMNNKISKGKELHLGMELFTL